MNLLKKGLWASLINVGFVLCFGTLVLANASIRIIIDGKRINTQTPPKIIKGAVWAPLKEIAEALGATVLWDKKSNTIVIHQKEEKIRQTQTLLLEKALEPKDPFAAVNAWAEGVKSRNGALQYAVMSASLKRAHYQKFAESNWTTGVSSPWVERYDITEKYSVDDKKFRFEVKFIYMDATRSQFIVREIITVEHDKDKYWVTSIHKIDIKGEINKGVTSGAQKIKSIVVKDKTGESRGYDLANVIVDGAVKIYNGYTDQKLTIGDLQEGSYVEITFAGEPKTMIYPVTARAEIIRVFGLKQANKITYQNIDYGFRFLLPDHWKGYTVLMEKWEGSSLENGKDLKNTETGALIRLRHPQWTAHDPRQDIPIMVLTMEQWSLLKQDKIHIGAAPMGPSELGRNSRYVFALPARYNYAFPTGYEEVERIVESNKPLETMEVGYHP